MIYATCCFCLILHHVADAIAVRVGLKVDKPPDCIVTHEDEHPYLGEIFQHACLCTGWYKMGCLLSHHS